MKKAFIDLREQMNRVVMKVERQYPVIGFKNKWRVFLGLRVIQIGCWLTGIEYEESTGTP